MTYPTGDLISDASAASSGLVAVEFVLQPETWPVFVAWMRSDPRLSGMVENVARDYFEADCERLLEMAARRPD